MITKKLPTFPTDRYSINSALQQTKERCKMALKKQVVVDEDEEGKYIYEDCTDEVAEKEIGALIDHMAYLLIQSYASGRAQESVIKKILGKEYDPAKVFKLYLPEIDKETNRKDLGKDYKFDCNED